MVFLMTADALLVLRIEHGSDLGELCRIGNTPALFDDPDPFDISLLCQCVNGVLDLIAIIEEHGRPGGANDHVRHLGAVEA